MDHVVAHRAVAQVSARGEQKEASTTDLVFIESIKKVAESMDLAEVAITRSIKKKSLEPLREGDKPVVVHWVSDMAEASDRVWIVYSKEHLADYVRKLGFPIVVLDTNHDPDKAEIVEPAGVVVGDAPAPAALSQTQTHDRMCMYEATVSGIDVEISRQLNLSRHDPHDSGSQERIERLFALKDSLNPDDTATVNGIAALLAATRDTRKDQYATGMTTLQTTKVPTGRHSA